MAKMRAVQVARAKGPFEWVERDIPEPGAGSVRIKVQACGICNSDSYTAEHYIDSQAQDPAAELSKLGGAKVILATVTNGEAMSAVLGGLAMNGKRIVLGAPADPLQVPAGLLIGGRRSIVGWPSGSSIDSQDTLAFSTQTGVRSTNELFPLERAAEGYERMMSGKARFRVVLTTGNEMANQR
ncbi:MAG: hypothetical protein HY282_06180 [Nitrospirae bacterium]|nr:hypothetical protein [Candidatus Manganitrophaceae bacterium]